MKIGITGGIGAGKSTVTGFLERSGYEVIDCDLVSREVVEPGSPVLGKLADELGEEILDGSGGLDREKTARIVFSDPEKRKTLDRITHSAMYDIIMERAENAWSDPVFIDAALIFETGLDKVLDEVWVVTASEEVRAERVASRDGMPREMIEKRMESQMSEEERKARADRVIDNSGSVEDLYGKIRGMLTGHDI